MLTFEFKKKTKYKRIQGIKRIFLKGHFHRDREHMMLFVLLLISSQIRACHIALSPNVRQWSFQGISIDPIIDLSLKSIKGSLYPKKDDEKSLQEKQEYL